MNSARDRPSLHRSLRFLILLGGPLVAPGLPACSGEDSAPGDAGPDFHNASGTGGTTGSGGGSGGGSDCEDGQVQCEGDVAKTCDGQGGFKEMRDCGAEGLPCMPSTRGSAGQWLTRGCVECMPGEQSCEAGRGTYCPEEATGFVTFDCDPIQGMTCTPDGCLGECAPPFIQSYIGCDYYPTVTPNPVWRGFDFAVAISNAGDAPATVLITQGSETVEQLTVDVDALEVVPLPWALELKGNDVDSCQVAPDPGNSRLAEGRAYRIRSDTPVTVYQFSPLQYLLTESDGSVPIDCPLGVDCNAMFGSTDCLSYSNDASLLLPATTLTGNYSVLSWPSVGVSTSFFSITATENGTVVDFAGAGPYRPGGGVTETGAEGLTLNRGDVLQVLSEHGDAEGDVSGTRIRASKPIQVIGGNSCAFVPTVDQGECDHLEEAIFPSEVLGNEYVVSYPAAIASRSPHVVRIVALVEDTMIQFDPDTVAEPRMLGPNDPPLELHVGSFVRGPPGQFGDVVEPEDFHVLADKPIMITQYMEGQEAVPSGAGDPSMSLAVPVTQFRDEYIFTASKTYDANFVNLIIQAGSIVTLDDQEVMEPWIDVGDSGFAVIRLELSTEGDDVHRVSADRPFGLLVYGYGRYTSYMYPGGLDLVHITVPPPL